MQLHITVITRVYGKFQSTPGLASWRLGTPSFTWLVHSSVCLAAGEGTVGHAGLWELRADDTVTHLRADTVLL